MKIAFIATLNPNQPPSSKQLNLAKILYFILPSVSHFNNFSLHKKVSDAFPFDSFWVWDSSLEILWIKMDVNEDHTLKEAEFEVQSVEEAYSKDFFRQLCSTCPLYLILAPQPLITFVDELIGYDSDKEIRDSPSKTGKFGVPCYFSQLVSDWLLTLLESGWQSGRGHVNISRLGTSGQIHKDQDPINT